MKELAPGLWQLSGFPPQGINVYLMGDVLVDAATRRARPAHPAAAEGPQGRRARADARPPRPPGREPRGLHRARDPVLGRRARRRRGGGPAADRGAAAEDEARTSLIGRFWTGPGHPVDRRLREGDDVAGFTVLDVPGHSAGHVAYWRESDRVLVLGDVLNNMNVLTGRRGLLRAEVRSSRPIRHGTASRSASSPRSSPTLAVLRPRPAAPRRRGRSQTSRAKLPA